ncbi:M1 family metallopeptidase [Saccharicrinis sp. GN24d3]|uniref:M1 family metallopeptidase n=1 Tax=Saccharicrinis sp. GN24d3 TaxID=3458416 RepID=UPI00403650F1
MKYLFALATIISGIVFFSCRNPEPKPLESGVSLALAEERFNDISNIEYKLELTIPDSLQNDIEGTALISLNKKNSKTPLVLDFVSTTDKIQAVLVNDEKAFFKLENEHLVIPPRFLQKGKNKLEITFILGNGALNRNDNYFYSLFVPARARTAIPCFDQPDLKAKVSYSISMPKNLTAITNGKPEYYEDISKNRKLVSFASSKPISTYLWAFAVGEFKKTTQKRSGREISIYHMETDSNKIIRNTPAIFDQVFHSINWLEDYTEVDFPFSKYDLVCIPSFQFGGMEHPGAVYYRSELLFLSESPTQQQLLRRAQLIAHETAHMWFGDLVTMKWFSGVWQKEVFANFMADKIVEEQFPALNHKLTFLTSHFPASYSVDRTIAANPIQQKLVNLNDAGSMYGNIIYHKAPIMMNQLENLTGKEQLRKGLGKYLKDYSYANATWYDLMEILNDLSEYDLQLWSNTWTYAAGRPIINFNFENKQLVINQQPEYGDTNKVWPQRIQYCRINASEKINEEVELLSAKTAIEDVNIQPEFILPTINEGGYGLFLMDDISLEYAINNIHVLADELARGAMLVQLFENFMHGEIAPSRYLNMLQTMVSNENNEQILTLACNQLVDVFWRFTTEKLRTELGNSIEQTLFNQISIVGSTGTKKLLFNAWSQIVATPSGLKKLKQVIKREKVYGASLSERDVSAAVLNLALKDKTLDQQFVISYAGKLKDEELKNKMLFVSPVFSSDNTDLDKFVTGLQSEANRKQENWVLTALSFLHHPYRNEHSIKYLEVLLDLTETIKETGDIFFPIGWLNNTLGGYGSLEAEKIIDYFFKDNPNYPEDLKRKILQSADMIKRSRMVKDKYLD